MTLPTLAARPTHKVLPLLRSEISRISHRRLFRIFALVLLGGIIVISAIAFANHHSVAVAPDNFGTNTPYRAKQVLPVVALVTSLAVAGIAFVVGASSGGAEWSSRSMTLQLLWEPRRLRLLTLKWLGLVVVMLALALVALLLALGLGALTASMRGTWTGHLPNHFGDQSLGSLLALMVVRGFVFIAMAATIGYAIAVLVRNTGASLGVAFIYFAVAENALRIALMKYGPEPYLLSTNAVAFLIPGGLDVPGRVLTSSQPDQNGMLLGPVMVHLSNARALFTMLVYTALISIPAAWSFARRDVS